MISSISVVLSPAFFKADLQGAIVLSTKLSTSCSNLALDNVLTKCFGIPSTGIMYGKLISVDGEDDNSIFAFSAPSRRR